MASGQQGAKQNAGDGPRVELDAAELAELQQELGVHRHTARLFHLLTRIEAEARKAREGVADNSVLATRINAPPALAVAGAADAHRIEAGLLAGGAVKTAGEQRLELLEAHKAKTKEISAGLRGLVQLSVFLAQELGMGVEMGEKKG